MNEKRNSGFFRILPQVCVIAAIISVLMTLWGVREFELNHFRVGYGDPEADRYQVLLAWGMSILAVLAVSFSVVAAIFSRRALISIVTGTALAGLPFLVAHWLPLNNLLGKAFYVLAFPGIFATILMVGVHGDGGWKVAASSLSVNAIVYGAIVFLVVRKKVAK